MTEISGDPCVGEDSALSGQDEDEVVTSDELYDWVDDPALSPEDIRARLQGLPEVPVFTSREECLVASCSVLRLVESSSTSGPDVAEVIQLGEAVATLRRPAVGV
jgi:hypothetical protein